MSKENVEVVRRLIDAYLRGDYEQSLEPFLDDAEVDARHFPEGRVYRGPGGLSELMRSYVGTFDDYRLEIDDLIDAGDKVVMLTHESGISKGAGVPVDGRYAIVFTVENGRIARWQGFVDRRQAFDAAGLDPEPGPSEGESPTSAD